MSTTTVILLVVGIAAYLVFVAFVLALLMAARHADEETERNLRVVGARTQRFARPDAAREVEGVRRRRQRHPG
jgi:hypothetical protein